MTFIVFVELDPDSPCRVYEHVDHVSMNEGMLVLVYGKDKMNPDRTLLINLDCTLSTDIKKE